MIGRGSLSTRVLVAATILLLVFFGFAFIALDLAFRRAAEASLEDLLQSQVMGLLAAADPVEGEMLGLPDTLPETRFSRPGSGLYGRVIDEQDETVWTSRSALGLRLPAVIPEEPGRIRFDRLSLRDGTELLNAALRIEWEFDGGRSSSFVFMVTSSLDGLQAQIRRFRTWLGSGFGVLLILLLGAQLLLLRKLMRPLGQAESEVRQIEAGTRQKLSDGYPAEIQALSASINGLIDSERSRTRRYRESLDNLAHSLKTPLAVIRSQLEGSTVDADAVNDQVSRMHDIVDHQLRRAAAAGVSLGHPGVAVSAQIRPLLDALAKVYTGKHVRVSMDLDDSVVFPGERDDLMEVLGNVLDNAFKYCAAEVRVRTARQGTGADAALSIAVEDDGPGLTAPERERLLGRGVRGSSASPGQGIGLAVVTDIVEALGGSVSLGDSALGGACVEVRIPVAPPA